MTVVDFEQYVKLRRKETWMEYSDEQRKKYDAFKRRRKQFERNRRKDDEGIDFEGDLSEVD